MTRGLTYTQRAIKDICKRIEKMLLDKNKQYGNSIMEPLRVFSTAKIDEQIKVRIDDKLSRLMRGNDQMESDTDVIEDLIGYLIMLLHSKQHDAEIEELAKEDCS